MYYCSFICQVLPIFANYCHWKNEPPQATSGPPSSGPHFGVSEQEARFEDGITPHFFFWSSVSDLMWKFPCGLRHQSPWRFALKFATVWHLTFRTQRRKKDNKWVSILSDVVFLKQFLMAFIFCFLRCIQFAGACAFSGRSGVDRFLK